MDGSVKIKRVRGADQCPGLPYVLLVQKEANAPKTGANARQCPRNAQPMPANAPGANVFRVPTPLHWAVSMNYFMG